MIPVLWLWLQDEPHQGFWDWGMIRNILDRTLWNPVKSFGFYDVTEVPPNTDTAVFVIPGRQHADKVDEINHMMTLVRRSFAIITGDEERDFPIDKLKADVVWLMHPKVGDSATRFIPNGYPPHISAPLKPPVKDLDFFFAGQITHQKRRNMAGMLRNLTGGQIVETEGFTQGLSPEEYYAGLARAKVSPCPPGPVIPDSFRLYEALEMGCVPIVDNDDFWESLFPGNDLYKIGRWGAVTDAIAYLLEDYPANANRVFAWWQGYKRDLAYGLQEDIGHLTPAPRVSGLRDKITALVPTSPTPNNPDTSHIEGTIESIRDRLPDSEIIVMIDGVRPEQESMREDYEEYQRRLLWMTNHKWGNVFPLRFETHHHQAKMTKAALGMVKTDSILFVEHDTPLCDAIPFAGLAKALRKLDVVRLYPEGRLEPSHKHLFIDKSPVDIEGQPFVRTKQWSQRPHLARTSYYQKIIKEEMKPTDGMIEDRMHSVVQSYPEKHRIGIYHPQGHIKRSTHSDARGDQPKYVTL